jgi:hypothetical protein
MNGQVVAIVQRWMKNEVVNLDHWCMKRTLATSTWKYEREIIMNWMECLKNSLFNTKMAGYLKRKMGGGSAHWVSF